VQSFDVGGAALVGGAAFGGGHPVRVGLHGSGIRAEAPGLEEALERAVREGAPYVILDGTIVSSDRCQAKTVSRKGREIDLWYAGKKDFGRNIQGLFYPDGLPMWVSDVLPRNVMTLRRPGKRCSRCCGRTRARCPPLPTAGTKAQVTASSRQRRSRGE
jgi:hypothetical protein